MVLQGYLKILLIFAFTFIFSFFLEPAFGIYKDQETLEAIKEILIKSPLQAVAKLHKAPDYDEKYALLYLAELEIAKKSRMDYYYNGKINPRGFHDEDPNRFEIYIMNNSDHFTSASEGNYKITPTDYWLKRIINKNHSVFGDFEFEKIKDFDEGVWEDGDGSMHTEQLIKNYQDWAIKFPTNNNVPIARDRIEDLKNLSDIFKDKQGPSSE